ncbi:HAD family hydrolase [Dermatobacter hominis]|uniref:HAD family hydrolase n=1 Tax=Dermatobacter hominis TaxID=2884263 RepID=UPI001D0F9233|nr:HAD family hydrolase [Dermatobacter hominis]UDY34991.1 HAD family hydrolase [Dermatobacter hominis]
MTGGPGVLFDVDGTLVDSNYLHTLAWSRALREGGHQVAMNVIHRLVGMGGDQLTERLLGEADDAAVDRWRSNYEQLRAEVTAFPGASELVGALHDAGVRVVLASSSPADHVEAMIDLLGVADVIDAATSSDDADSSKPAPDIFEAALAAGDVDRGRALVVGDSIWDVQAARAAGLATAGVESGGFSRHELTEEGALAVYRHVGDLRQQWRTGPLGQLLP